jgi:hypothetical protein
MNIYSNRWSGVAKSIYTKFIEKNVLLLPVTVTNKLHARNMMVSKRKPKRKRLVITSNLMLHCGRDLHISQLLYRRSSYLTHFN